MCLSNIYVGHNLGIKQGGTWRDIYGVITNKNAVTDPLIYYWDGTDPDFYKVVSNITKIQTIKVKTVLTCRRDAVNIFSLAFSNKRSILIRGKY